MAATRGNPRVIVITEDVQNVHLLLEYRPHIDVSLTCDHDSKHQEYCVCPQNMPQFDSEGIPNQAPETNKPMILNGPTNGNREGSDQEVCVRLPLDCDVVRSVITYAAPAWGFAAAFHLRKLQVIQNQVIRLIIHLPRVASRRKFHDELDLPTIDEFIARLARNLYAESRANPNPLISVLGLYDPRLRCRHQTGPLAILLRQDREAGVTPRAYQREFGVRNPPKRNTILGLVNKLETTGSLVSEKGKHRSFSLPTVVVDVRARLEQSPKKSLRRLSQETVREERRDDMLGRGREGEETKQRDRLFPKTNRPETETSGNRRLAKCYLTNKRKPAFERPVQY
ncbi:hypothetical protein ANN_12622 [Periplaneta americana]|uniref:DUF4817 domain-containing protein n=1 Tax=Periplaneta americana TaxID=6978 RepID=A0ABQ8TJ19_PERAM|nr:hypothetical protein ANN_12622 [Periplaneta americana]